jgi:hypothetical protein
MKILMSRQGPTCVYFNKFWELPPLKKVIEIGGSHVGGIYQAGAGMTYHLGKGLALRVEYRFYHVSDPFRADRGLNTHNALLGISF